VNPHQENLVYQLYLAFGLWIVSRVPEPREHAMDQM
jgi:hypothetical protein